MAERNGQFLTLVLFLLLCLGQSSCELCTEENCKAPLCICPSTQPPAGLKPEEIPQIVMITFDDSVAGHNIKMYRRLFNTTLKNPNFCPIQGTFFVSDAPGKQNVPTSYDKVEELYERGHELASHSITHKFPMIWWNNASKYQYIKEFVGERTNMVEQANVDEEEIVGMRVPFLQNGGDNQFQMLAENQFLYDSSLVTGPYSLEDFTKTLPYFPYTLHVPPEPELCDVWPGNCPRKSYPGLWEVPLNRMYAQEPYGTACSMADDEGCKDGPTSIQNTFKYLKTNFDLFYNRNRAPFGVFLHSSWFTGETKHTLAGLEEFIHHVVKMPDVWVITVKQAVEWMKNPTTLENINDFQPWRNSKMSCARPRRTTPKPHWRQDGVVRYVEDAGEKWGISWNLLIFTSLLVIIGLV